MKTLKIVALSLVSMMSMSAMAQDKVEGTVGADVVSRYVWRGQVLGDAAIQPTAGLSYKGFALDAWASYSFVDSKKYDKEFDLTLSYSTGGFNVGVTDYYFSKPEGENKYFEYRNGYTKHVWEAFVGYDFGCFDMEWYTNFAGNDGVNKSGKRAYSSYFTLSAPFKLATCDWKATVGIVPYATDFYADANGFAVTNVSLRATKEFKVCKNWSVPVFAEGIANPSTKKGYLVVGMSLGLPE